MRKCLTKIEKTWFERVNFKLTKIEKSEYALGTDKKKHEISEEYYKKCLKKPNKEDILAAENAISNILDNNDTYNIINIILPSCHGSAVSKQRGFLHF